MSKIAARDICGSLVREQPDLVDEIVFGVVSALHLEALSSAELLARWGVVPAIGIGDEVAS